MRKKALPKGVVDTNLIVSGLLIKRGSPYELVAAWRRGAFTLLISPALQAEYEQVLPRPKFAEKYGLTADEVRAFLTLVSLRGVRVAPQRRLPVKVRHEKDEKVLAAALGGKADYLITGDNDLLVLRDDPHLKHLKIVTVAEFLEILTGGSTQG